VALNPNAAGMQECTALMNYKLTTKQSISLAVLVENQHSTHILAMFTEKFPDNPVPTQYTTHNLNKSYKMDASMHDLLGSVDLKIH
jgi:hypothetical protein